MNKLANAVFIATLLSTLLTRDSKALPPSNIGMYVSAGHFIQRFDAQTGSFLGNVATTWDGGSSNAELHFGPDGNLYGLGSNHWVFKYDIPSAQTTVFAKPLGTIGASGLALGPDLNWYVGAGNTIQKFGPAGTFLGNVTTNWISGASNAELQFGPDGNIYGIGNNAWIFKYDFALDQTTVFAMPTGDSGATGLALGADSNWYVVAGHYVQKYSSTGAFLGNITTSWIYGSSNTDLHFGPDNNLYGLGSNAWVYKYDFATGQTSVFVMPTGDSGANGLAFLVPEPTSLAFVVGATVSWLLGTSSTRSKRRPVQRLAGKR